MGGPDGSLWMHWHAHPDVLLGLALIEGVYLLGVGPLRTRYNLAGFADSRQTATFTAGVLVIFVSLLSPIHELADTYLFSAHMVQHVLLTLVAPPLLILGTPVWLVRRILRPDPAFIAAAPMSSTDAAATFAMADTSSSSASSPLMPVPPSFPSLPASHSARRPARPVQGSRRQSPSS